MNPVAVLSWESSTPLVATIDFLGHVHPVDFGSTTISARYGGVSASTLLTVAPDTDGDGKSDPLDNCSNQENADQRDTDGDGFGNRCDADLNQSNFVNAADLALFKTRFGTNNADADLDGNGFVNAADLAIFKALFGKAPGPSGLVP
jgi:hypothetical protein